jgi:hypothetical protein
MVKVILQNVVGNTNKSQEIVKVHTTLYDLIDTINAEVSPDEDDVLTATVVHLLNTRRVICTGELKGYRLVCNLRARPLPSAQKGNVLLSHFERYGDPYESSGYKATL